MSGGASLGILGGGQLARLICEAAAGLNLRSIVLSADPDAVARDYCDRFICAPYDAAAALRDMAAQADVVTLDNEHVPLDTLHVLEQDVVVHPGSAIMRRISDRLAQRRMLARLDLPQTRFWSVDATASAAAAQRDALFPAVLKTRQGGYDGLGQQRVNGPDELPGAWAALERRPCVLEAWLHDVREFSLVGARGADGAMRLYPPIENFHARGQLQTSRLPLTLEPQTQRKAEAAWISIAGHLGLRGVMTVEFFLNARGEILINEIAPRVHNSGHLTQLAFPCSQFELHARAVAGLPLPELGFGRPAVMLNIYPEHGITDRPAAQRAQAQVGGQLIWYGKTPRPRRKMGHWLLRPEQSPAAQAIIASPSPVATEA